jgi:hypothetical protein
MDSLGGSYKGVAGVSVMTECEGGLTLVEVVVKIRVADTGAR